MGSRSRSGVVKKAVKVTPNNDNGIASCIPANAAAVDVQTVTNGVTDWILMPALDKVPDAHQIIVCCNAGGNFEVRTPVGSAEKINAVDCDVDQEYLAVDTQISVFTKVDSTYGWSAYQITNAGVVDATATTPD